MNKVGLMLKMTSTKTNKKNIQDRKKKKKSQICKEKKSRERIFGI